MAKAAATLTYFCLINERSVFETFTSRKAARERALYLSKHQMAKNIKVINHA
jgi:hypothetical protein